MKEITFTKHILEDSSRRIPIEYQKTEESIKRYLKGLFCNMYNGWIYEGEKVRHYDTTNNSKKMVCHPHKFVYREYKENIKLITYIIKTDNDCMEHGLIDSIRFHKSMPHYFGDITDK